LGLLGLAWGCGPTEYESEGPASSAQGSSLGESEEQGEGEASQGDEGQPPATSDADQDRADGPRDSHDSDQDGDGRGDQDGDGRGDQDGDGRGDQDGDGHSGPRDDQDGDDQDGDDQDGRGDQDGGAPRPCLGWEEGAFEYNADRTSADFEWSLAEIACDGPQFRRFDAGQGLWVGLVSCAQGGARFYLSEDEDGRYLPATDWAGHGQDFCELVDPGFTLGNEDDINSGSCSTCSTSVNVPLEGIEVYTRGVLGEQFERSEAPQWSYQTSVVQCAWMPNECNAR
jgi:hypothetical protein